MVMAVSVSRGEKTYCCSTSVLRFSLFSIHTLPTSFMHAFHLHHITKDDHHDCMQATQILFTLLTMNSCTMTGRRTSFYIFFSLSLLFFLFNKEKNVSFVYFWIYFFLLFTKEEKISRKEKKRQRLGDKRRISVYYLCT